MVLILLSGHKQTPVKCANVLPFVSTEQIQPNSQTGIRYYNAIQMCAHYLYAPYRLLSLKDPCLRENTSELKSELSFAFKTFACQM